MMPQRHPQSLALPDRAPYGMAGERRAHRWREIIDSSVSSDTLVGFDALRGSVALVLASPTKSRHEQSDALGARAPISRKTAFRGGFSENRAAPSWLGCSHVRAAP